MKSILVFLVLLISSTFSFAQIKFQSADLSEVSKHKFHAEIGVSSLSRLWNGTAGGTLLLKRSFGGKDLATINSIKLLRTFVSVNAQINFSDDPNKMIGDTSGVVLHPAERSNVSFGIGLEKQKQGKRLSHTYGLDFFGQYSNTDSGTRFPAVFNDITFSTLSSTNRFVQTIKVGINPFIGAKYYFNDQFSLGIEAGFQIFYLNTKITEVEFERRFVDNKFLSVYTEKAPVSVGGLGILFNGVRFITMGYAF